MAFDQQQQGYVAAWSNQQYLQSQLHSSFATPFFSANEPIYSPDIYQFARQSQHTPLQTSDTLSSIAYNDVDPFERDFGFHEIQPVERYIQPTIEHRIFKSEPRSPPTSVSSQQSKGPPQISGAFLEDPFAAAPPSMPLRPSTDKLSTSPLPTPPLSAKEPKSVFRNMHAPALQLRETWGQQSSPSDPLSLSTSTSPPQPQFRLQKPPTRRVTSSEAIERLTNRSDLEGRGVTKPRVPHTTVERRYRENLNSHLQKLRMTVPNLQPQQQRIHGVPGFVDADDAPKPSKCEILSGAIEYISMMEAENQRLVLENQQMRAAATISSNMFRH